MHNINLVRTYEHIFPAVIWCVMRILIFYLVWNKNSPIYLVSACQHIFFWCITKTEKNNLVSPKTPEIKKNAVSCGYWVAQSRDGSMNNLFNTVSAIGQFFLIIFDPFSLAGKTRCALDCKPNWIFAM